MPLFSLVATAELESIATVSPSDGFLWRIQFVCSSCREPSAAPSVLDVTATFDLPSGHGVTHLVQICKFCASTWTAEVHPTSAMLTADSPTTILADFECRGCTPTLWLPGDGWTVVAAGGADTWEAVDLFVAARLRERDLHSAQL